MASSRVPCPQCGTLNFAQDPVCLGCGAKFAPRPAAAPVRAAAPQYAPDEMCLRCFGVLLPASQFDTRNMAGGVDDSIRTGGIGIGGPAMAARELSGIIWFFDLITNLLVGSIIKKNFDRRLQQALREHPNSLCCPSCRAIVRR